MGVTFDRAVRISGDRPSTFKDALRGYLRTKSPGNLIDLKSVFPLRRDGAIVYEECIDRGLIDPATHEVTDRGLIVARAKVMARTPLAKARQVLDDFLDRVDQLNSDPEAVSRVDEVWLFGSLMREEETVGDIDLAVRRSRDPQFSDLDAQVKQAKALIAKFKDAPQHWAWPWDRIDWLFRRTIFGARRHPLLAGVQEEITDLASLGVACRLIYDRSRGGRIDDPILPRHPESPGRSNSLPPPPPELPDFTPAELRPMDARWVAGFNEWGSVSPYDIFRGWTDECRKLFPRYPENLRIVADGHKLHHFPWIPRTIKKKGLDGRLAVAIIDATEWWGTCITLHRAIEGNPDGRVLRASFSDLVLHRSRRYIDLATLPDMVAAVSLILAVDAERILRRAIETGTSPRLTIQISAENLPDDMRSHFAEEIVGTLNRRAIAIEPVGEAASVRIELS